MKGTLVAISLCALFTLALITVRLRTRETLLRYDIAELETYEELLLEKLNYSKSEMEERMGMIALLNKAFDLGIHLYLNGPDEQPIPLLLPVDGDAHPE